MPKSLQLLLWASLALLALQRGLGAKCDGKRDAPSVRQTQIASRTGVRGGEGEGSTKFKVEVQNNCPMCPIINLHLKCQGFPQLLVDPTLLRVLSGAGDCVVNDGLPVPPLQKISFNYSSDRQFPLRPGSWFFQCE